MTKPMVESHDGVLVVRDDLFEGGTKARFIPLLFNGVSEVAYASPAEGGAQTALATVAALLGKRATIFVAQRERKKWHDRTLMAKRLGAEIVEVPYGYLRTVQKRAEEYCHQTGALLAPFGFDVPGAAQTIAAAARSIGIQPDEVWCAGGSGVLARGLAQAWPNASLHVVQVGRTLNSNDVADATIHEYPKPFKWAIKKLLRFPSDPHYDAKAWEFCLAHKGSGSVLFWNVTGPAQP